MALCLGRRTCQLSDPTKLWTRRRTIAACDCVPGRRASLLAARVRVLGPHGSASEGGSLSLVTEELSPSVTHDDEVAGSFVFIPAARWVVISQWGVSQPQTAIDHQAQNPAV